MDVQKHIRFRPLDYLNGWPALRLRRLRIVKTVRVGRETDLILSDERRITLRSAAELLNPARFRAAFLDQTGILLPRVHRRRWHFYVALIVAAAEIQEVPLAA